MARPTDSVGVSEPVRNRMTPQEAGRSKLSRNRQSSASVILFTISGREAYAVAAFLSTQRA
jgi:hypothetical protein